ncbi:MAG: Gfo/Idh/MocA family protein, partial [Christensenellales bacterium]
MRFGIVGTSFIADWLLEASRHVEGFEAAAVCSRRWETGEAFAGKHGIPGVYTDMVQMAESGEIDAAYIASPNGFHAQQCLLFIRRGIPVLCEKAFASNQREAQQVIDEAHERGVFVMEAIKSLFMPSFEALKAALPEIGKVRRAVFNFTRYSSRYDAYLRGEAPNAFKRELSNGSLLDIGVYALHPAVA